MRRNVARCCSGLRARVSSTAWEYSTCSHTKTRGHSSGVSGIKVVFRCPGERTPVPPTSSRATTRRKTARHICRLPTKGSYKHGGELPHLDGKYARTVIVATISGQMQQLPWVREARRC